MTFPNLVIGGAPKCGTSSLFSWLADHPAVCGSRIKEPFFLMDRGNPMLRRECNLHDHGLDAYSSFFGHCDGQEVVLEGTTHYLYQQTALETLAALPTEPRVLFLLRKPSERVHSSFLYSKNRGNVSADLSFAEFVRLVRDGPGETAPDWARGASAYVLPRDIAYSRYAGYLRGWRDRLGPERLRLMLFEEMRADPRGAVQSLCGWSGIDPAFYEQYDFATRNPTRAVRSPGLQRFARKVAARLPGGSVKAAVTGAYYALQSKRAKEQVSGEDEAALAELDLHFEPFNRELEREFGLDLSAWRR